MPDRAAETALLVRIRGRVQGVWYRAWTVEQAAGRDLRGWVRNRRDGSVEALFCGPASQVRDMIEACRRGPPAARVESIDETAADVVAGSGFITLATE